MKKYFIGLLVSMIFVSCDHFLEEKMNPAISNDYLNTEQGAIKGMNAVYHFMKYTYGQERTITAFVFGTDEYVNGSDGDYKPIGMYTNIDPSRDVFWQLWDSWYKAINNCNLLIDNIPNIPAEVVFTDQNNRNILLGEALFMRAFFYYHLVLNYGSVPMPLKGNKGTVETSFSKASESAIFSQIISDLRKAAEALPLAKDQEFGRATKGAAQMLLSRAYLARVSKPDDRKPGVNDLDSVIYFTGQVIQSNEYILLENYADIFAGENDNNKEIIFAVQNTPDLVFNDSGSELHMFFYSNYEAEPGMQRAIEAGGRSYKRAMPTDFLMDVYDRKNDSRFYKSYLLQLKANNAGTIPKVNGVPKFALGDTAFYYSLDWVDVDWDLIKSSKDYDNLLIQAKAKYTYNWHPRNEFSPNFELEFRAKVDKGFSLDRRFFLTLSKHLDYNRPDIQNKPGQNNVILIRFAEAYMMRAEAFGRKGNFTEAAKDLNKLRQRAAYKDGEVKPQENWRTEGGIKGDVAGTYTQIELSETDIQKGFTGYGDFIDFILDEMAREFNGECRRWMDLARFGRLVERVKKYNPDAMSYIKDFHQLRPIPTNHIERLIPQPEMAEVQNPGYY